MNKRIINLRNIFYTSIFKQNIYSFITGIISCVDRFAGKHKIFSFFFSYL